ncbi:MAG TPA: hypothetical protein DIC42_02170 [Holosporales bacterium]|nr:hypothetical protein [Holosporales bacterium]
MSAFSVRFPNEIVQEIDQICNINYITRSSWLITAAREKLLKERMKGREEIISKITSQES